MLNRLGVAHIRKQGRAAVAMITVEEYTRHTRGKLDSHSKPSANDVPRDAY